MIDLLRVCHSPHHYGCIAGISHGNSKSFRSWSSPEPLEIVAHARTAEIIKNVNFGVCTGEQLVRQIATDKSSATEYQYGASFIFGHGLPSPSFDSRCQPKIAELGDSFCRTISWLLKTQPPY